MTGALALAPPASTRSTSVPARSARGVSTRTTLPSATRCEVWESRPSAGRRTVNTVPSPTWLCTSMVPPWRSTSDRTIDRPSPVPAPVSSRRTKRSKTWSRSSCAMPWPSSATDSSTSWPSPSAITVIVPPSSVYWCALEIRFTRIWRTRTGSARTLGSPGGRSSTRRWSFSSTRGPISTATSSITAGQVEQAGVDLHPAGLQPGHVQQVVHQLHQPVGALQHHVHELALAVAQGLRPPQQLHEALDRGQRAAQLVRGGGHEVALHPLQPRPLGDVADGPHQARAAGRGQAAGGGRQRPAADLDRHVAGQAQLGLGQRAVARVGVDARGQAGHQLGGARVGRGHHALLVR